MQLEINNQKVINMLQQLADDAHQPIEEVLEKLLENNLLASDTKSHLERFKNIQAKLLEQNGGKLFSDSTLDIRESRLND